METLFLFYFQKAILYFHTQPPDGFTISFNVHALVRVLWGWLELKDYSAIKKAFTTLLAIHKIYYRSELLPLSIAFLVSTTNYTLNAHNCILH